MIIETVVFSILFWFLLVHFGSLSLSANKEFQAKQNIVSNIDIIKKEIKKVDPDVKYKIKKIVLDNPKLKQTYIRYSVEFTKKWKKLSETEIRTLMQNIYKKLHNK